MGYELRQEGKAIFYAPKEKKVSSTLTVFYNPSMQLNRDVSVWLLNNVRKERMQVCLPLAGTGVRGIRFLKELKPGKIASLIINDKSPKAVRLIKKNLAKNKIRMGGRVQVTQKDANVLLRASAGFDYLDLDPFGTPIPFLDESIKRIARGGVLAVTATDTAPLCGTYPAACKRKYWATPLKNEFMHESGLRILIRKIQLIGTQYQKALLPLLAYADLHYFRIFFKVEKGKKKCDAVLQQHQFLLYCKQCMERRVSEQNSGTCCKTAMAAIGPMWTGMLWDRALLKKSTIPLLEVLRQEAHLPVVGFYDVHRIGKKYKRPVPKHEALFQRIKRAGYCVAPTHFSGTGIRTDMPLKAFLKLW